MRCLCKINIDTVNMHHSHPCCDGLSRYKCCNAQHATLCITTADRKPFWFLDRTLQQLGAQIGEPDRCTFNGLEVELWPRLSWSPLFALTLAQLKVHPQPELLHGRRHQHACLAQYRTSAASWRPLSATPSTVYSLEMGFCFWLQCP